MGALLQSAWAALRRRAGLRVDESEVRRLLLAQAGVEAVESVRAGPGPASRQFLLVRIRIADGCDAGEVTRRGAEALLRLPSVSEINVLASAGDGPAAEPAE